MRVPGVARMQVFGYVTSMVHPVQSVIESLYAAGRCPRLHVNASHNGVICPDFIREQWKERLIIDLDASYPLDLTFGDKGLAADLSFGGYVTRCEFPWKSIYIVADRATGRGIVLDRNMPESVRAMFQRSRSGGDRQKKPKGPGLRPLSTADRRDQPTPVQVLETATQKVINQDPKKPPVTASGGGDAASRSTPYGEAASDPTRPSQTASDRPISDKPASSAEQKTDTSAGTGTGTGTSTKKRTPAEANSVDCEPEVAQNRSDEKQVLRRRAAFRVIDGGG